MRCPAPARSRIRIEGSGMRCNDSHQVSCGRAAAGPLWAVGWSGDAKRSDSDESSRLGAEKRAAGEF